jgi:hypothetical protein
MGLSELKELSHIRSGLDKPYVLKVRFQLQCTISSSSKYAKLKEGSDKKNLTHRKAFLIP